MSDAEKIHRFALYVQSEPTKINAIQTVENGLTGSKLQMKTDYDVRNMLDYQMKMQNLNLTHIHVNGQCLSICQSAC